MKTISELLKEKSERANENTPVPVDCTKLSVDRTVLLICDIVNKVLDNGEMKYDGFYAGICKDVKSNMQRHLNDAYIALVDSGTRKKAGEIEERLGELGFDVGDRADNGGDEETTIVYVIKKDSKFRR